MAIDPEKPDTGAAHGSGLEQTESEPKQGVGESWSENRPADWDPPPGNPGADQEGKLPLPPDDQTPVEEEMKDVDANNSVSSEHPEPR